MNPDDLKKYLEEEMSEREKNALEKKMADDPFFAEGLEGLRQWRSDTGKPLRQLQNELEEQVQTSLPSTSSASATLRMPWVRILLVAACLAGICFLALQHFAQSRDRSEKLFSQYFRPLSHPDMTVRGADDPKAADEKPAIRAYETENYKQAIQHYQQLVAQQPGNDKYTLFLGISYLANYQPELAVEVLGRSFPASSRYEIDRQWYLAMAYLRLQNIEAARELFRSLSDSKNYYRDEALELLKVLD